MALRRSRGRVVRVQEDDRCVAGERALVAHELADAYAFLGNSLLKPVNQVDKVGLFPEFWKAFPTFGDADVGACVHRLYTYAKELPEYEQAVEQVAFEYTKLFFGPPKPQAAPWETMYGITGCSCGFGAATFEMRNLLRSHGLKLSNTNHQYEDHIGIELLVLSELCRRAENDVDYREVRDYIKKHPLHWVGKLRLRIAEVFPCGYVVKLVDLAEALMAMQVRWYEV
ncbi:MAG TPA: molecular chaperone TorD family protein [Candidatus Rubneribacter avistercoris]|nr:molecular chaperone TorD family protein [Candidatus Rubneribacter avistercoris]